MSTSPRPAEKRPGSVYESSEETSDEQVPRQQQVQSPQPKPRRRNRQRSMQQRQQNGPLDQLPLQGLPVDNLGQTVNNTVGGVTDTLGNVAGGALNKSGGSGKSDTLRLRLDLNLDVEITLKARIHGDLELALLET
jgi:hypothetical protein